MHRVRSGLSRCLPTNVWHGPSWWKRATAADRDVPDLRGWYSLATCSPLRQTVLISSYPCHEYTSTVGGYGWQASSPCTVTNMPFGINLSPRLYRTDVVTGSCPTLPLLK